MGFLDGVFGTKEKKQTDEETYMKLDLQSYEGSLGETSPATMYVKIASVSDIKECPRIKDEIYNGNIVIVDITKLKLDKMMFDRVMGDLRAVARDVNGDIIGLGDQRYVIIVPTGVRISREKICG
ncbi:MAG TPA: cell division protein SepF [Methanocorpusculum sp.]|nr:cell division protein SepF [Clostridia bacterium]MDO5828549.1 cell division protein SepF [Methanocorpusculum sp.]HJJ27005.1 cell division protein SepF [Methanocorpusculum sp.]HJJ46581.1 cell division protein SepF [Methanocorpusculum sp.]